MKVKKGYQGEKEKDTDEGRRMKDEKIEEKI